MFLTNARSMSHKMDKLELQVAGNRYVHNCCVMTLSEIGLQPLIPNAAVQLSGCTVHWLDRNKDSCQSRGCLCIYIHNGWSDNSMTEVTYCSPDWEFRSIKCLPFFLQRKLTVVMSQLFTMIVAKVLVSSQYMARRHKKRKIACSSCWCQHYSWEF